MHRICRYNPHISVYMRQKNRSHMRIKSAVAHMRPHHSLMRKMPGNPNDAVEYTAISNGRKDITRNDGQKYGHTSMHTEVRTEGCKVVT